MRLAVLPGDAMIDATIGRIVYYFHPHENTVTGPESFTPCPAIVMAVHDGNSVDLFCPGNITTNRFNVPHFEGDNPVPGNHQFWYWMPYQKEKATRKDMTESISTRLSAQATLIADLVDKVDGLMKADTGRPGPHRKRDG